MSDTPKYYRLKKAESICYSCRYSKQYKTSGLHCQLKNEKPNILFVCYDFKIFDVRDDKIHKIGDKNQSQIFIGILILAVLIILFLLTNITITLLIMLLSIFFYSAFYASKPNPIVISHGWFVFLYLVFSKEVIKNKETVNGDEPKIIEQNIIKLVGRTALKYVKNILFVEKYKLSLIYEYSNRLSSNEKNILFMLICELYVFDNYESFDNSNFLFETAHKLGIESSDYQRIKQYVKYYIRSFNKKAQDSNNQKSNSSISKYLKVLDLSESATVEEIKLKFKQLAKEFHPDKLPKNQKYDDLKFKEVSEAYNYLKKIKGF